MTTEVPGMTKGDKGYLKRGDTQSKIKRRYWSKMGKELRNAIKRIAVLVMAFVLVSAAVSPALAAPVKKAPSLCHSIGIRCSNCGR
jgi:hypothetical protein